MSTPFPANQTPFQISSGSTALGHINLSKTPLATNEVPPPRGGATPPPDNNGSSFPARFQHTCNQVESDLAALNGLLFNLNSRWAGFSGTATEFASQNQSSFAQFGSSANKLRGDIGNNQLTWPLVPPSGPPSSSYSQKSFPMALPQMTGMATFVSDQESSGGSIASWGFITNYAIMLVQVADRSDPSSSSSYYSTASNFGNC